MKDLLRTFAILPLFALLAFPTPSQSQNNTDDAGRGYYRFPTIHNETIVFTAEGDLWRADINGGEARRLTSHPGEESRAAFSSDGTRLAFSGQYDGRTDVYVMSPEGGLPKRLTYNGERSLVVGWTPEGEVLYTTRQFSTLPCYQLAAVEATSGISRVLPLDKASDGCYNSSGKVLYFTRLPFMGSYTKRYKGGMAQNIWSFETGGSEAANLTADYAGTSKTPMWHDGRIYFVSDRDGILNLWSISEDGNDPIQHTFHRAWDVKSPSISNGRIVYQLGADIHVYDIESGTDREVSISLVSDFDQMREKWVEEPMKYLTSAHLSPEGDRVVLTARGQVFVAPTEDHGRFIEVTRNSEVRYRSSRFLPGGESVLTLSDATGELEFWKLPADGIGEPEQMTDNGTVFRFDGLPSPDGKFVAYTDKEDKLWLYDTVRKEHRLIKDSDYWEFAGLAWSPDSRWLAFSQNDANSVYRIYAYNRETEDILPLTSDRYEDNSPAWSPDGQWLYFLSDRNMKSVVSSSWVSRQPFPFLDKKTKLYMLPLVGDLRSPFEPDNELTEIEPAESDEDSDEDIEIVVKIDTSVMTGRLIELPVPAGNYGSLTANKEQLFWLSWTADSPNSKNLQTLKISSDDPEVVTLVEGVASYEISANGKKLLVRKGDDLYVINASNDKPSDLNDDQVNLSDWAFAIVPGREWKQMFIDAWRMERDYFYDPGMHGNDWNAVRDRYLPLVDRVTDRAELSDLIGEMVGELSSLHIYVFGGDYRSGPEDIPHASLGARLERDERSGGYRVEYVYRSDPDEPSKLSPLARPEVNIGEGDVIEAINGVSLIGGPGPNALLRRQSGKQVRLTVRPKGAGDSRDVIVEPISYRMARDLRYRDWEYTRRLQVEEAGDNEIGYVHLRAMSGDDYSDWAREFYPILNRKGLIVDVRHNNGGNIDTWILTSLLRRPWVYWKAREGIPYPNMHNSFAGHLVVICDEYTVSDGELFCEGFRRLGLGEVVGTRTLGGEIWLSFSNWLVDKGIASAAASGVFAPEGEWVIEGHGFEPDIPVENLPHATFKGRDAQLEAAIEHLKEKIRLQPIVPPTVPDYPDKSFKPERSGDN